MFGFNYDEKLIKVVVLNRWNSNIHQSITVSDDLVIDWFLPFDSNISWAIYTPIHHDKGSIRGGNNRVYYL